MRIEQLQYLLEIYKTQSFTVAANNLFVSQPAISDAIKKLEQELDAVLIIRTKNSINFTPIGLEAVQVAESILNSLQLLKNSAFQSTAKNIMPVCSLTIYTLPLINDEIILHFLPQYNILQPNVKLNIFEYSVADIFHFVSKDACDIGIFHSNSHVINTMEKEYPDIVVGATNQVLKLKLYALTKKDSLLATKNKIGIKELKDYPIALNAINDYDATLLEHFFFYNGIDPNVTFKSNKKELIHEQVLHNNCISITHSLRLKSIPEGIAAIPIDTTDFLSLYYIYSRSTVDKSKIYNFLNAFIPFCENIFSLI